MASNEKKPNTSGKGSTVDILKNRGKQIDQAVKDAFGGIDTEDYFNNSSKSKKALQQELRATVAKGMKLIHSPGIRENIYKNLQTGNPVEKIADITVTVMNKIDKAVQKSGQKVPDEIKAAAANALMAQVFEIGEVSGLVQLDDEEKEATFSNAVSKYIQGGIQSGEIDKEALAEETGRSVQSMTPEQRAQIDTQMKRINEVAQASAAKYGGQLPVEQPTQGMLAGGGTEDVNA